MTSQPSTLARHHGFRRLWIGQTMSEAGSVVSLVAIPLVAVISLHAGALELGALGAAQYTPFLVLGLPAGAWVDRVARRPLMIAADTGRAALFASVPLAWWAGHLGLPQLLLVAFGSGVFTVFFEVAYRSYLPGLVGRPQLLEANARLELSRAATEVVGPGLGGALIRAVGAPWAVGADALSFAASAICVASIRAGEPAVERSPRPRTWPALRAGLSYVARQPTIRAIALTSSTYTVFAGGINAILLLYAVTDLGLSPLLIGVWFSLGSVTSPLGAWLTGRLVRRHGVASVLLAASCAEAASWLPVAAAPRAFPLPLLILSGLVGGPAGVIFGVLRVSLQQRLAPDRLLGRVTATTQFCTWGALSLGALLGGILAAVLGLRAAVAVLAGACLLAPLPILRSRASWNDLDDGTTEAGIETYPDDLRGGAGCPRARPR